LRVLRAALITGDTNAWGRLNNSSSDPYKPMSTGVHLETAVCLGMLFPNVEIWRRELANDHALSSPLQKNENPEIVDLLLL